MRLDAANTAIVLDSTADFPAGTERFPNWRVVPLYVNVAGTSYRDYVDLGPDDLYATLAGLEAPPTTSQPTPGDFLAVYEELAARYERIYSLQLSSTLSGTYASAQAAALQVGEAVRVVDTQSVDAREGIAAMIEDDAVSVRCTLAKVGRSSVTTREEIRVGDELAVEAEAVLVARDPETNRSRPLLERERAGFERVR